MSIWDSHHFSSAPSSKAKTDISIFTSLLTPTPQRRELVSSVNGEGINAR
jgi:hypothetical protein